MNKKYTALLLVVLVAAAEASNVQRLPLPPAIAGAVEDVDGPEFVIDDVHAFAKDVEQFAWQDLGMVADVNNYVDNALSMVSPAMQTHGLDPMPLPEVVEGFSIRNFLITYSAWLKIHDGYMTGLSNVRRSGDQTVNYFAKMLRVRVQLQFEDTQFEYRYLVTVMNIGPRGGIRATLSRFVVIADILIDFNNDEVHLQQFSLTEIGRLRVRFTGNLLTDWLMNPVIGIFVAIFDSIIMNVVQVNIRNVIQQSIGIINSEVGKLLEIIEAYNIPT